MINLYDILYASALGASAPFWVFRQAQRRKVLTALRQRMGWVEDRGNDSPAIMIHAVSVGEINATVALVGELARRRPGMQFIISVTTETGWERGRQLYGARSDTTVIRYPLDFSAAVARVLDHLRPIAVALMELEVWPNFIEICSRRRIPVVVLNGRLTPSSLRNYQRGGALVRRIFAKLSAVCAQDQQYAEGFASLGVPADRLHITGTMKFDTAPADADVPGASELAADVGLAAGQRVWVAGSTGPGEERIVLDAYRKLREAHPDLRLVIVPRHPQRFDEVAEMIGREGLAVSRRSRPLSPPQDEAIILGDTMGELRKFYALADVVFVGRTLVDLGHRQHGSDMIEPAALARPTIVGPFTANFADAMRHFRGANATVEIADGPALAEAVDSLLNAPGEIGQRARAVVQSQGGATARNTRVLLELMKR